MLLFLSVPRFLGAWAGSLLLWSKSLHDGQLDSQPLAQDGTERCRSQARAAQELLCQFAPVTGRSIGQL